MNSAITCSFQSCNDLLVQYVDICIFSPSQEVLLNIFDYIFNFTFRPRIPLTTENDLEAYIIYKTSEAISQQIITQILFRAKDLILVVYDLFRNTAIIFKGEFVCVDG